MDRDNVYSEAVRMYTTYSQRLKQYNYKDPITNPFGAQSFFKQAVFIGPVFPFNVHHILFLPTILSQGTDDQIAKFCL
ncbi:hypothetical protein EB796_011252 [Bugula neritina]|uniref:Acyl-coenzyme A oxidase N-terminal domain-containing protein n=1 Tax=Bugula neritina TaxID=10212 RepID=A0A7J7JXK1_BUGNE|nr:hypothetical protein EB796_011252 [Bugula neritina]